MIIGIDGYIGAGKDTCAQALIKDGFTKVAFADALRNACSQVFNIPLEEFQDRDIKEKLYSTPLVLSEKLIIDFCELLGYQGRVESALKVKGVKINSHRHLLQFVGTDLGRKRIDNEIWLNEYRKLIDGLEYVVSPDARFFNERELIHGLGGLNMWVEKPDLSPNLNHRSEQEKWSTDKYDIIVINDKSITRIQDEVRMWWSLVGSKK